MRGTGQVGRDATLVRLYLVRPFVLGIRLSDGAEDRANLREQTR